MLPLGRLQLSNQVRIHLFVNVNHAQTSHYNHYSCWQTAYGGNLLQQSCILSNLYVRCCHFDKTCQCWENSSVKPCFWKLYKQNFLASGTLINFWGKQNWAIYKKKKRKKKEKKNQKTKRANAQMIINHHTYRASLHSSPLHNRSLQKSGHFCLFKTE